MSKTFQVWNQIVVCMSYVVILGGVIYGVISHDSYAAFILIVGLTVFELCKYSRPIYVDLHVDPDKINLTLDSRDSKGYL